jgi:phage terminase small subunit
MGTNGLTPKQERFCEEYVIDLNATQAAIRAGYSEKTAKVTASKMLTKANVQERITELKNEINTRNGVSADFVINGIKEIAVKAEQENTRLKAFELLGRHVGIFERDNRQKNDQLIIVGEPKEFDV